MVNKLLLLLLLPASLFCTAQKIQHKRTILFVGAHPDDETAISEVLHKYARLGNKGWIQKSEQANTLKNINDSWIH